jgi:hypothetical protein
VQEAGSRKCQDSRLQYIVYSMLCGSGGIVALDNPGPTRKYEVHSKRDLAADPKAKPLYAHAGPALPPGGNTTRR